MDMDESGYFLYMEGQERRRKEEEDNSGEDQEMICSPP